MWPCSTPRCAYTHFSASTLLTGSTQTAKQRDAVMCAQADAFFADGRYFQAAQAYAQCSVTFEEVSLKFLDAGERDPLRSYLISRLERTKKTVRPPLRIILPN